MRRVMMAIGRTVLLVIGGILFMIAVGKLIGLTSATCTTICKPEVAGSFGAVLGLILAVMLPSLRWKPLEEDDVHP